MEKCMQFISCSMGEAECKSPTKMFCTSLRNLEQTRLYPRDGVQQLT